MADVTITPASFVASASAKKVTGTAGDAIAIGKMVYLDSTTNLWELADANVAACATAALGIAATESAASGQDITVVTEDIDLTPGGTLSLSAAADDGVYVLSATAGGIAPVGDLASTMYPIVLGVAKSTSKLIFKPLQGTAALTA